MRLVLVCVLSVLCISVVEAELCAGNSGLHTCGEIANCTTGVIVTGLCSGGNDNLCCLNGDVSACSAQNGTCMKDSNCEPSFGDTLSGLCPGDSSVKCCVPKTTGTTCPGESSWNLCLPSASCSDLEVEGICDGSDICCIQGSVADCTSAGGTCVFEDTCEAEFGSVLSGLCPGSANIKCCVPNAPAPSEECDGQDPSSTSCILPSSCTAGVSVPGLCSAESDNECCFDGSDSGCVSAGGSCKKVTDCAESGGSSLSGLCPGNADVKCCIPPSEPVGDGPIRDKCFPLQFGSLAYISQNWGSRRSGGARCHAGIDIFTQSPGLVIAVSPGEVVNIFGFLSCKDGWSMPAGTRYVGPKQSTKAIMVYNAAEDVTYNYGEVDYDQIRVSVGDMIEKGDIIGRAGYCGMLHFESYSGRRTSNLRWYPPEGELSEPPDKCAQQYLHTKPSALNDPRPLINGLNDLYCGVNGRAIDGTGQYLYYPTSSPEVATPAPSTDSTAAPTGSPSVFTTASPTPQQTTGEAGDNMVATIAALATTGGLISIAAVLSARMVMRKRRQDRMQPSSGPKVYFKPPEL